MFIDHPFLEVQLDLIRRNRHSVRFLQTKLDLSNESLINMNIEILEALIMENCISGESLTYLVKNGNKDIKRIIMEYKLNK